MVDENRQNASVSAVENGHKQLARVSIDENIEFTEYKIMHYPLLIRAIAWQACRVSNKGYRLRHQSGIDHRVSRKANERAWVESSPGRDSYPRHSSIPKALATVWCKSPVL